MAIHEVSRLAPVTARDGVDTRNKENSTKSCGISGGDNLPVDMITGLGQFAVYQNYEGVSWGDVMTDNVRVDRVDEIEEVEPSDYRVWEDMTDEPYKYGDDIYEWLDLNDNIVGRWRIATYWILREEREKGDILRANQRLEEEQKHWKALFTPIAKKAAATCMDRRVSRDIKAFVARIRNAVVRIQSTWRGYAVRRDSRHTDCCMCLAHVDCPIRTDVGYMCRECRDDGPHVDIVENDPWNWFREVHSEPESEPVDELCKWCRCPLDDGQSRFCDTGCEWDFISEQ